VPTPALADRVRRAGKDAVADALQRHHGFSTRTAFADRLRALTIDAWRGLAPMVARAMQHALNPAATFGADTVDLKTVESDVTPPFDGDGMRALVATPPLAFCQDGVWTVATHVSLMQWMEGLLATHLGAIATEADSSARVAAAVATWHGFVWMLTHSLPRAAAAVAAANGALAVTSVSLAPLTLDTCLGDATKEAPLHAHITLGNDVEIRVPLVFVNGTEKGVTPRSLLEWLGTDVMRANLRDDVWLAAVTEPLAPATTPRVVITDARFPNELLDGAAALEAKGFTVVKWRLINPHEAPPAVPQHVSATAADAVPVDETIVNDKTRGLAALETLVEEAYARASLKSAVACAKKRASVLMEASASSGASASHAIKRSRWDQGAAVSEGGVAAEGAARPRKARRL